MKDTFSGLVQDLYFYNPLKSNYLTDMSCEHEIGFPIEEYAIKIAYFDEVTDKIKDKKSKLIFILKCIGYSYYEIGCMVKVSKSTVGRRYNKVISLLKKYNIFK